MKIIEIQSYGGIDWHDSKETTTYLKENEGYNITDTVKAIEDDVVKQFQDFYYWADNNSTEPAYFEGETKIPDKRPSVDEIRKAVRNESGISAGIHGAIFTDDNGEERSFYDAELTWNPDEKELISEYAGGQFTDHTWYVVRDIPDENVRYLVLENFLCPNKGVPSVTRFYTLPYKTQEEAEKALDELKLHERDEENVWAKSIKELKIIDVDETPNTTWYALNIHAIRAEEHLKDTLERYEMPLEIPFRMYVEQHIKALEEADEAAYNARIAKYMEA